MDAVWAKTTADWPAKLPSGVKFSDDAPLFFHPADGKANLFHEALPNLIAARYWRCAWIDEALRGNPAAWVELEQYESLPDVGTFVDQTAYDADFAAFAERSGSDPLSAEFAVDCGVFTDGSKEGNR